MFLLSFLHNIRYNRSRARADILALQGGIKRVKIEKIEQNKLKITLSCTEMLQINPEIAPEESQKLISELFHSLEAEYGFSIMNQKIVLEMIPSSQDGCNIFITKSDTACLAAQPKNHLAILSFSKWSTMEYALTLLNNQFLGSGMIYRLDGMYYLILYAKSSKLISQAETLLSDLGECVTNPELFVSVLQEYGIMLTYSENFFELLKE